MRLSLRTLLAFEDNVFDVEQHRRLEQILPTDPAAGATLQRIRSVIRNPMLGVPGRIDQKEELDPNYVAEYLDHQMPNNVQEQFESYCLSADKYIAEISSIHHILSNVLGEPARTSRECRLKCYGALPARNRDEHVPAPSGFDVPRHFQPEDERCNEPRDESPRGTSSESASQTPASFWQRWFRPQAVQNAGQHIATQHNVGHQDPAEPKPASSVWTFTVMGLCVCALLIGWQQIEKQRYEQKLRNIIGMETFVDDMFVHDDIQYGQTEPQPPDCEIECQNAHSDNNSFVNVAVPEHSDPSEQDSFHVVSDSDSRTDVSDSENVLPELVDPLGPIEQVAFTATVPIDTPTEDPIPSQAETRHSEVQQEEPTTAITLIVPDNPKISFQPMPVQSNAKSDVPTAPPLSLHARQPLPVSTQKPDGQFEHPTAGYLMSGYLMSGHPMSGHPMVQHPLPNTSQPHSIALVSGTEPQRLGRAVSTSQPDIIFSAASSRDPWQLSVLPFDLDAGQYLLTAAPFRGTFELANSFRITMVGDSKLCILPPDASGTPGIFVDYGRIVIHSIKANRPLRIEMERARGIVSVAGTESILFIDTFAEISASAGKTRLPEEQPKTSPILSFVPKNGEQIVWKSMTQPQPFYVNTQGSVLLQSEQYRLGEIQNLPGWIKDMPMSQEDRMLAEVCRRYFREADGDSGRALTRLVQHETLAVQILGLRLWGDLGEFSVPLTVMVEKEQENEAVRYVLRQYFREVMRRDAETIQRFTDAIDGVKQAQRR